MTTNEITNVPDHIPVEVNRNAHLDINSLLAIWLPILLGVLVTYLKARTAQIQNSLTAKKVDDIMEKTNGQHTELLRKTDEQTKTILGQAQNIATLEADKVSAKTANDLKDSQ